MFPEASSELRTSIKNNSASHPVQLNYLREVQLSIVGWSVCRSYRNEISSLGQAINNHPYRIVPFLSRGKPNNEIHADFFPLLTQNRQKLQQSCRLKVNCLYPAAGITPSNISCYFLLHLGPPETRFQVLIHFATTKMNGQLRGVSFI